MLAADQLPLDEELAVDAGQSATLTYNRSVVSADAPAPLVQRFLDLHAVLGRGPADEGEIGQVPGQADAAADHDVRLRACAAEPLAAVAG